MFFFFEHAAQLPFSDLGSAASIISIHRWKLEPPCSMAAALSLKEDILALVKKHRDTCLPEDLLARVAEEARLLAVREQIRYVECST